MHTECVEHKNSEQCGGFFFLYSLGINKIGGKMCPIQDIIC